MSTLRAYEENDFDAVDGLWRATMDAAWPLPPEFLRQTIHTAAGYQPGECLVAEQDGRVAGFIAAGMREKSAGIQLLIVSPEYQRRGIGTALHDAAMDRFRVRQVENINLAHGGGFPLFPGVPHNLPGAMDFFTARGWQFPDTNYDMTRDLSDYQTPPGVLERAARQGIDIRLCRADEAPAVIDFEQRVFPFWTEFFQMTADDGRYDGILAAWDGDTVVGSVLLSNPDVAAVRVDALWHRILGDDMGTIGTVGVDEPRQGNGIGLAMVAKASEILKARGVKNCLIGWTDLLEFYGKLGYTAWRAYGMTDV